MDFELLRGLRGGFWVDFGWILVPFYTRPGGLRGAFKSAEASALVRVRRCAEGTHECFSVTYGH